MGALPLIRTTAPFAEDKTEAGREKSDQGSATQGCAPSCHSPAIGTTPLPCYHREEVRKEALNYASVDPLAVKAWPGAPACRYLPVLRILHGLLVLD
jgi:hypothetical protein